MTVHLHGFDPSCREYVVGGFIVGSCWLSNAARLTQQAADQMRASALMSASDDDEESASSFMQDATTFDQLARMLRGVA